MRPGTCPLPQWGSRSRGSWRQIAGSSLSEQRVDRTSACLRVWVFIEAFGSTETVRFPLYLFHSTAVHPPCGTCCPWLAVCRQHRRNRTHARSVSGHSWPPAEKVEDKMKNSLLEWWTPWFDSMLLNTCIAILCLIRFCYSSQSHFLFLPFVLLPKCSGQNFFDLNRPNRGLNNAL